METQSPSSVPWAQHISGCNPESKLVAYLAGSTGNGDSNWTIHF
jgi:hypothetical protein